MSQWHAGEEKENGPIQLHAQIDLLLDVILSWNVCMVMRFKKTRDAIAESGMLMTVAVLSQHVASLFIMGNHILPYPTACFGWPKFYSIAFRLPHQKYSRVCTQLPRVVHRN